MIYEKGHSNCGKKIAINANQPCNQHNRNCQLIKQHFLYDISDRVHKSKNYTNDWVGETEKALHKVLENKIFHTDEFVSKIAKDACTRGSSLIACNMQNVALFSPEISKDAGSGPEVYLPIGMALEPEGYWRGWETINQISWPNMSKQN